MNSLYTIFILTAICLFTGAAGAEAQSSQVSDTLTNVTANRLSVSELKIRGRIQGQFANTEGTNSNTGTDAGNYSSFELRRVRLGVQGKVNSQWNFMVEANLLSTVSLDAAILTFAALPEANITFGKAKPRFGHEENTSSASILTFERTRLSGRLKGGKPLGLRLHGRSGIFTYYLGLYNGQTDGTGRMDGGEDSYLYNASTGLNLGNKIGEQIRADLRADYLHTKNNTGYYSFENAFALSGHFGMERVELRTEFMKGETHDNETLSGYYLLPSYYIVPKSLQAVFRYENVNGDTGFGIGHNRYADRVPGLFGRGRDYYSLYTGLNYYIDGHNMKLMLGFELAENKHDTGNEQGKAATFFSGFRMQF